MDEYNEEEILKYVEELSNINCPQINLNPKVNFDKIFELFQN